MTLLQNTGIPSSSDGKASAYNVGRPKFDPRIRKIPWRRNGNPLQYSCGESHGLRSLAGYSSWGRKESDMTERLHFTLLQNNGYILLCCTLFPCFYLTNPLLYLVPYSMLFSSWPFTIVIPICSQDMKRDKRGRYRGRKRKGEEKGRERGRKGEIPKSTNISVQTLSVMRPSIVP